jgi:hypothetical protein
MNNQIQLQKRRADYLDASTLKALSRPAYGDSWRKVILLLVRLEYPDKTIMTILHSEYLRWAAETEAPTFWGFKVWMRKHPKFFTPIALAVLEELEWPAN